VLLAGGLAGCSGLNPDLVDRPPSKVAVAALAERAAGLLRGSPELACGERVERAATTIVVATAQVCFNCRNIGYLIRRLASDPRRETVLVVPAWQGAEICEYLARERLTVAVLRAGPALFQSNRYLTGRFAVIEVDGRGTVTAASAERDPIDYFATLSSSRP
jgi:hypothetical protein